MKISHLLVCGALSTLALQSNAQVSAVATEHENSRLSFTFSQPDRLEWFVDNRRILVYVPRHRSSSRGATVIILGGTSRQIKSLNVNNPSSGAAFIEGERFITSQGVLIDGSHLAGLDNEDWAGYSQVNFGAHATTFEALVAVDPQFANQKLEIRLGSPDGTKIGEMIMQSTGGFQNFQWQITNLSQPVTGAHDVFLVAVGTFGAGNVDKFRFISIPR